MIFNINDKVKELIVIRDTTISNMVIGASENRSISGALTVVSGYTPVAITGFEVTGTGATWCAYSKVKINSNRIETIIRNIASTFEANVSFTVSVLYVRDIYT